MQCFLCLHDTNSLSLMVAVYKDNLYFYLSERATIDSVHKRSDKLPLLPEVGISVSGFHSRRPKCQYLLDVSEICQVRISDVHRIVNAWSPAPIRKRNKGFKRNILSYMHK